MSEAKPLHVRVAEALGCKPKPLDDGPQNPPEWFCECLSGDNGCPVTGYVTGGLVARYDTDWAATGPLIEKYGITVQYLHTHWIALGEPTIGGELNGCGDTALRAVCDLLELAFHPSFGGLKPRT